MEPHKRNCYFAVIVLSLCGPFQCYNVTVVNNIYKAAEDWYLSLPDNRHHTFAHQWGMVIGSLWIGSAVSGLFSSQCNDNLGRKRTLVTAIIIYMIGGCLMGLLYPTIAITFLIVGRFVTGIAYGLSVNSVMLWTAELAPLESRGSLTSFVTIAFALGNVVSTVLPVPGLLGNPKCWLLTFVLGNILTVILLPVVLCVSDSPRFLFFQQGPSNSTIKSIEFYQGSAKLLNLLRELQLEDESQIAQLSLHHIVTEKRFRKSLFLCILLLGHKPLFVYAEQFGTFMTEQAGMEHRYAVWTTVLITCASTISTFVLPWLLNHSNRKPLILVVLSICAACNLSLVLIFTILSKSLFGAISVVVLLIVQNLALYILYGVNIATAAEVCTQEIRAVCLVCGRIVGALGVASLSYSFQPLNSIAGIWPVPAIVVLLTLVVGTYLKKDLPETRNNTFYVTGVRLVNEDGEENQPLLNSTSTVSSDTYKLSFCSAQLF